MPSKQVQILAPLEDNTNNKINLLRKKYGVKLFNISKNPRENNRRKENDKHYLRRLFSPTCRISAHK